MRKCINPFLSSVKRRNLTAFVVEKFLAQCPRRQDTWGLASLENMVKSDGFVEARSQLCRREAGGLKQGGRDGLGHGRVFIVLATVI